VTEGGAKHWIRAQKRAVRRENCYGIGQCIEGIESVRRSQLGHGAIKRCGG
jgi:hypothetical protein